MDATVITLLPYPVSDKKPGLSPSEYLIPAAADGGINYLRVGDGTRSVYLDHERGREKLLVTADVIARSLVDDYVISQPAQDQTAGPGLFWLKGSPSMSQVMEKEKSTIEKYRDIQRMWFQRLVRMADDTWTRSHIYGQIGDLERTACRQLGLKRDWLDDSPEAIQKCPVCTTLISTEAIVCFACHVVLKPDELKAHQFLEQPAAVPVQGVNTK